MTNMSLPLTDEKSEAASFINGSAQARQRAAAVFSVPSASNKAQTKVEGLDTEMFRDIARTTLPIDFAAKKSSSKLMLTRTTRYRIRPWRLFIGTRTPMQRWFPSCACTVVASPVISFTRCGVTATPNCSYRSRRLSSLQLGIIIYLPHHEGRGIGLVNKIKAYAEQDRGLDTVDANLSIGAPIDARDYELPAKILKDLGYEKIRLMTNNPLKVEALERHGIEVLDQCRTVTAPSEHNKRYLDTKRDRMSHNL